MLTVEARTTSAGMDPKTARKYLRDRRLPSEMRQKHTWRTRPDPFADVWDQIRQQLILEPGLQAKTLFQHLQEAYPAARCGAGCCWPGRFHGSHAARRLARTTRRTAARRLARTTRRTATRRRR